MADLAAGTPGQFGFALRAFDGGEIAALGLGAFVLDVDRIGHRISFLSKQRRAR